MLQLARQKDEVIYVGNQFRIITRLDNSESHANIGLHASPQLSVMRKELLAADVSDRYDENCSEHLATITVPVRGGFFLGEDCLVRLLATTSSTGNVGFEVWGEPGQAAFKINDRPDHPLARIAAADRKKRA